VVEDKEEKGFIGKFNNIYEKSLRELLENKKKRFIFFSITGGLLLASLLLVPLKLTTVKMLPFDNKSELQVMIDMNEGTTLEETGALAREIGEYLKTVSEVDNFQSYIGTSAPFNFNGLVRHYFLRSTGNLADIQVNFVGKDNRKAQSHDIAGRIRPDIKKIAVMAAPVKFDDAESGHGAIREVIRRGYDPVIMDQLFGPVNIPPQVIDSGMNEIQPGVQYTVSLGFYGRVQIPHAAKDAAPFLYWLTHGTRFPAKAHREWIERVFMGNEIAEGKYRLPSSVPELDGKPVDMGALRRAGVQIFSYRGTRDPIAPAGSCVASELWGMVEDGNLAVSRGGLNRTIEKNVGHIFVVSKQLLAEYLDIVLAFFRDERPGEKLRKTA